MKLGHFENLSLTNDKKGCYIITGRLLKTEYLFCDPVGLGFARRELCFLASEM